MSEQRRGRLIVVEGPDGVGKTTQRNMLVDRLRAEGGQAIAVHEPGSTEIGQQIRRILLDVQFGRTALTSFLLFTADRVELWHQTIEPALAAGIDVVTDRNWLSSAAYQGHAEGLGVREIHDHTARFLPPQYMYPDLTIFLHSSDGGARHDRLSDRGGSERDTFESRGRAFQEEVFRGYVTALGLVDLDRVAAVEADGTREDVHAAIWEQVQRIATEKQA